MSKIILTLFIGSLFITTAICQPAKMTKQEYIAAYKDVAIQDMAESGIPASITIAQGILESSSGNSKLARKAKNHFGIKCHGDWQGPSVKMDDDARNECFRKYKSVLDSYRDHSKFLTSRKRYAFLFDYDITAYKKWAHGLKKAGYATNPKYGNLLVKIIEENELYDLDKLGQSNIAQNQKAKSKKSRKFVKAEPIPQSNYKTTSDRNNVPYTMSKTGDTWLSIAEKNDMMLWQVLKYNDAEKYSVLNPNSVIYIKPKRGSSKIRKHIAKQNESIYEIAQLYAVKVKKLRQYNQLAPDEEIKEGQLIWLCRPKA